MKKKNAKLILEDGSIYEGFHFGSFKSSSGEVVFNTAMTGYTESITDPSYKGQILLYTYPIIGNYGIPFSTIEKSLHSLYESDKLHINGLIVSYYTETPYHWNMYKKLSDWLEENDIPALSGLDTRMLTKKFRKNGTMLGKIIINNENISFYDTNKYNLAAQVSINKKIVYGKGRYKIMLVDCGVKYNIIRCLIRRNCTVIRVPWDYDFTQEKYDGLFISNGPGNPYLYLKTIMHIKIALTKNKPVFGICLGNQLMGLAIGANIYKLKYGHRGHNQPVLLNGTNKAYVTSQNHSYVIDINGISNNWKIFFKNLNDGSCEGLIHNQKPFFSVQFHPEACGGPNDTEFLFDSFINSIKKINN